MHPRISNSLFIAKTKSATSGFDPHCIRSRTNLVSRSYDASGRSTCDCPCYCGSTCYCILFVLLLLFLRWNTTFHIQ